MGTLQTLDALLRDRSSVRARIAGGTDAATVTDSQFAFTVPCSSSLSTLVGSTCSTTTTANAVMPGLVKDAQRAIWQLDPVQLFDGGSDGVAQTTGDNMLFMGQGIFVP